jgi:hypothetical protein
MSFEIISSDGGTWPMSYGIGEYTATQSSGEHEIVGHQTNTHLVHGQRHRYSVKLLLQSTNPNGSGGGYEVFWYIDNILQTTALCNLATSSAPMLALGTNSPTLPNW